MLVSVGRAVGTAHEVGTQNTRADRHIAAKPLPHHDIDAQLFA